MVPDVADVQWWVYEVLHALSEGDKRKAQLLAEDDEPEMAGILQAVLEGLAEQGFVTEHPNQEIPGSRRRQTVWRITPSGEELLADLERQRGKPWSLNDQIRAFLDDGEIAASPRAKPFVELLHRLQAGLASGGHALANAVRDTVKFLGSAEAVNLIKNVKELGKFALFLSVLQHFLR